MHLIRYHSLGVHDNGCRDVGRGDEALGFGDVEAQAVAEDDGEEVGDGVGGGGGKAEEGGEAPDFQVEGVFEVGAEAELVRDGVLAVFFDAGDDEGGFGLVDELPRVLGLFGEIDDEEVACDAEEASNDAFHLGFLVS